MSDEWDEMRKLIGDPDNHFLPPTVDEALMRKVKALPSSDEIWYVWYTVLREAHENYIHSAAVFRCIDKFHVDLPLTACGMETGTSHSLQKPPFLLAAIAQACLWPGRNVHRPEISNKMNPKRPRKVLLDSDGTINLMRKDLEKIGILDFKVARPELGKEARKFAATGCPRDSVLENLKEIMEAGGPNSEEAAAEVARLTGALETQYVSEKRQSLRGQMFPSYFGAPPRSWYARRSGDEDRVKDLWGWRTNLERAVMGEDRKMFNRIVKKYAIEDIRVFCNERILLTRAAHRGMLSSCKMLLEVAGVDVDGSHTPGLTREALARMKDGGDDETSPLHRAAHVGHFKVVKLLVKHGASLSAVCGDITESTALHCAVSQGHIEVVRFLCEKGSDIAYVAPMYGHDAYRLSHMMGQQGDHHHRLQKRVRNVLREYDPLYSKPKEPRVGQVLFKKGTAVTIVNVKNAAYRNARGYVMVDFDSDTDERVVIGRFPPELGLAPAKFKAVNVTENIIAG